MPSPDIYARCNFTLSGHPNTRFNVVIKLPKAKLEELRQLPANRDQTDNQLLGCLVEKVITIVYPELARRSRSAVSATQRVQSQQRSKSALRAQKSMN
jgi:hypothetical protein